MNQKMNAYIRQAAGHSQAPVAPVAAAPLGAQPGAGTQAPPPPPKADMNRWLRSQSRSYSWTK